VTDASDDMRILDEIATEIQDHHFTGLPSALRSHIKTKRALHVATVLETVARNLILERNSKKETEDILLPIIEGLRTDNQRLTDALLEATQCP
jgi:hypothetical protein